MNKLLVATAFLLIAAFSICGQTPPPSFSSGAEAFSAPPLSTPPPKKVDPEKEKLIRQVLARTQEAEMAQERILQGMAGMKQMMPRVPEKYWTQYRQLITVDELRNRLVYVYDKHYTSEELTDLLKFYDSPLGKNERRGVADFERLDGGCAGIVETGHAVGGERFSSGTIAAATARCRFAGRPPIGPPR